MEQGMRTTGQAVRQRTGTLRWALGTFAAYLTLGIVQWALPYSRDHAIQDQIFLALFLLIFGLLAVRTAARDTRHPIITSAATSGLVFFAQWVSKAPLTLVFPGLVQRDHEGWVSGLAMEGAMIAPVACGIAAALALGTRAAMRAGRRGARTG